MAIVQVTDPAMAQEAIMQPCPVCGALTIDAAGRCTQCGNFRGQPTAAGPPPGPPPPGLAQPGMAPPGTQPISGQPYPYPGQPSGPPYPGQPSGPPMSGAPMTVPVPYP